MSEQASVDMYWSKKLAQEGKPVYAARTEKEPFTITTALMDASRKRRGKLKKQKNSSEDI